MKDNEDRRIKFGTHLILFPIYLLPHFFKRSLSYFLSLIWYYVFPHRKKLIISNLQLAFPEKSLKEKKTIAFWSFYGLVLSALEYSYFPYISKKKLDLMTTFEGLEHLESAFKKKKGVLILSTHMGNGDLAVYRTCKDGFVLNLITKRVKNLFLDQAWHSVRAQSGLKHLDAKNSSIKIARALKKNEAVIFVLDQFTHKPVGIESTFFGHKTGTNSSLAFFALRFGSPVIPAYSYRRKGKLIIVFDKEIETVSCSDNMDEDVKQMTQVYNFWLEKVITKYPKEWMWIHKRWKKF